jgi:hypothetical protein
LAQIRNSKSVPGPEIEVETAMRAVTPRYMHENTSGDFQELGATEAMPVIALRNFPQDIATQGVCDRWPHGPWPRKPAGRQAHLGRDLRDAAAASGRRRDHPLFQQLVSGLGGRVSETAGALLASSRIASPSTSIGRRRGDRRAKTVTARATAISPQVSTCCDFGRRCKRRL